MDSGGLINKGFIDHNQLEANRKKNNLTSIPVTRDTLIKNSSNQLISNAASKDNVSITQQTFSVTRTVEQDEGADTSTT